MLWCTGTLAASARDGFRPNLTDLDAVPRFVASDPDAAAPRVPNGRIPFATGTEAPLDLSDGLWTSDGATATWRLRIAAPGARMLTVSLARLAVPTDARLYLYGRDANGVQGPFRAADVSPSATLSLPLVAGDEALLELQLPAAERDQVRLRLGRIYRSMRPLSAAGPSQPRTSPLSGESAAACETNVICPAGDSWRDPIRAVTLIQVGNGSDLELCSGDLVNNVRQDGAPYILTANHCGIGSSGYPASSVVVYWNFQADACDGSSGTLTDNQTGSTLDANDAGSDFALLRLNQAPPASFGVFYAGWDASPAVPQSGVGIHHPVADIKKISTFSDPVRRQTIAITNIGDGTQTNVAAWEVNWSSGIMEEGSSGSGLWNQDAHVVGVLSGGGSRCSTGVSSTGSDYFGRLEVAWQANVEASGQLKAWLDPDDSGTLVLDGKNPAAVTGTTGGAASAATPAPAKAGAAAPWELLLVAIVRGLRSFKKRRPKY